MYIEEEDCYEEEEIYGDEYPWLYDDDEDDEGQAQPIAEQEEDEEECHYVAEEDCREEEEFYGDEYPRCDGVDEDSSVDEEEAPEDELGEADMEMDETVDRIWWTEHTPQTPYNPAVNITPAPDPSTNAIVWVPHPPAE
ncbi:hypothetical protein C0991_002711, partial [Blastosporella zonata]